MTTNGAKNPPEKWNWAVLTSQRKENIAEYFSSDLNVSTAPNKTQLNAQSDKSKSKVPQDIESFSRLRIDNRAISEEDLQGEMKGRTFISLHKMDTYPHSFFADESVDWVTIGVLTRKTISKAASNDTSFMVWTVSDLHATELAIFLFDNAYQSHWKEVEGSIVAIVNATVIPAKEKGKFALRVKDSFEIVKLGKALDFGICKGNTSGDRRCKLAVNTSKSHYCMYHICSHLMKAGKGRQQLNNGSNFSKNIFSSKDTNKNLSTGSYGLNQHSRFQSGRNNNKRKRSKEGVLGVATILSPFGDLLHPQKQNRLPSHQKLMIQASVTPVVSQSKQRTSRGHRLVSTFLEGVAAKKPKKVDMMRFMSGQPS